MFVAPKTRNAVRTVPLTPATVTALRGLRQTVNRERLSLGLGKIDGEALAFTNRHHRSHDPNMVRLAFLDACRSAKVPIIRLHDLRHTAVTLMLADEVPVTVVSKMAGHASTSITMDVYAGVLPHQHDLGAESMGRLFG